MITKLFLIVFSSIIVLSSGQTPKVKKETRIHYLYQINGGVTIDTVTFEYGINGTITRKPKDSLAQYVTKFKPVTIDSTKKSIHRRQSYSDSTIEDIYEYFYNDSNIIYTLKYGDTISKMTEFLKRNRLYKKLYLKYQNNEFYSSECLIIDKRNIFVTKKTLIRKYDYSKDSSISKFRFNKFLRIRKEYQYNSKREEWYLCVKTKTSLNGKKYEDVRRNYDLSTRKYNITYLERHFNTYNKLVLMIEYDEAKNIAEKMVYVYEYY